MKTSSNYASWKQLLLNIPESLFNRAWTSPVILIQSDVPVLDFDFGFSNKIY